ncbi:hypothetical protein AC249_AIPGENE88 [Exaiptasia diaphana]|nr:hypothetical protein AC249_AIPGENE88 [Exaiptasia diaphana]
MPSSQRSRGKWWFEKSEDDKIQIYFETDENQSYSKSINVFDFTVNAVSGQFRNFLTSSEVFCKRFSDIYGEASLSDQDAEQLSNNEAEIVAVDSQENELSSSCTAKTPVRKSNPTINKRSSQASPTVETAQQTPPKKKKKRSGSNSDSDRENQSDEAFLIEIQNLWNIVCIFSTVYSGAPLSEEEHTRRRERERRRSLSEEQRRLERERKRDRRSNFS